VDVVGVAVVSVVVGEVRADVVSVTVVVGAEASSVVVGSGGTEVVSVVGAGDVRSSS
jgi:hypothetical protein